MKKEPAQVDHLLYQEQKGTQHTPLWNTWQHWEEVCKFIVYLDTLFLMQ